MPEPADRSRGPGREPGATRLVVVEGRADVARELVDWVDGRAVFVVTAPEVWGLHGEATLGGLARRASRWQVLEVPDGEAAKTVAVAEALWGELSGAGARRDSRVLTFGGGSVCDLGAFVAATYMRGIAFSHVPTTLLAQVDAAIGGKSALNLAAAKNAVGVFRHPQRIVASSELLRTLPEREIRGGLVEAIKMAALLDPALFAMLEERLEGLLADTRSADWPRVIEAAQRAKAKVVDRDPLEAGERRVLNFGHTLAHALEVELGYGSLSHGEAVAHGIHFAIRLAVGRGLDPAVAHRIDALLARLEPPTLPRPSVEALLRAIEKDKKAGPEGVAWVLPTALGAWEAVTLERGVVAAELEVFVARRCHAC